MSKVGHKYSSALRRIKVSIDSEVLKLWLQPTAGCRSAGVIEGINRSHDEVAAWDVKFTVTYDSASPIQPDTTLFTAIDLHMPGQAIWCSLEEKRKAMRKERKAGELSRERYDMLLDHLGAGEELVTELVATIAVSDGIAQDRGQGQSWGYCSSPSEGLEFGLQKSRLTTSSRRLLSRFEKYHAVKWISFRIASRGGEF